MSLHAFERTIVGDLPLGEAAAYFIRVKTAAKEVASPDETGVLEGKFSVPVEQALAIMSELVRNEFETIYAYTVYGQSLRELAHDSIADHFDEHGDDELEHANFLLKRMAVLGGPVHVPDLQAPKPSSDPVEIINTLIRMEQDGIEGWRKLLAVVGDNPMKVTIEDYMAKEQEHLDDLWQLLPHEDNRPVLQQKTAAMLEEDPAIADAITNVGPYRHLLSYIEAKQRGLLDTGLGLPRTSASSYPVGVNSEYSEAAPSVEKMGAMADWKVVRALQKSSPENVQRFGHRMGALAQTAKMPGVQSAAEDARTLAGMLQRPSPRAVPAYRSMFSQQKVAAGQLPETWLANEQLADAAQEANEAAYFKAQAQASIARERQKAQEAQALQQQLQQAQGQLAQSGEVQRQALDRAKAVEEQALQSAATAHQTASNAALRAMQASEEVLRHKMMSAALQQNVQGWRQQLLELAHSTPAAGAFDQVSMPLSGPTPEQVSSVPTDSGPPIATGAAEQAATPPGTANAPTPLGQDAQGPANVNIPTPEQSLMPATKQAGAVHPLVQRYLPQAVGAVAGGLVGGVGGHLMSGEDLEAAKERVSALEKRKAESGSFVDSLRLAKGRLFRDLVETAHEHPIAATVAPAAVGAAMGASGANRADSLFHDMYSILRGAK